MRTPLILFAVSAAALLLTGCVNNAVVDEPALDDQADTAIQDAEDQITDAVDDVTDDIELTEDEIADMADQFDGEADSLDAEADDLIGDVADAEAEADDIEADIDDLNPTDADVALAVDAPALLAPYSDENVEAAHDAGNDVIALVSADWCGTCQATKKALQANADDLPDDLTILDVNFDEDKEFVKTNKIAGQHTVVIIDEKGNVKEVLPGAINNADDAKAVAAKYFK